jgi:hypothetical protein
MNSACEVPGPWVLWSLGGMYLFAARLKPLDALHEWGFAVCPWFREEFMVSFKMHC